MRFCIIDCETSSLPQPNYKNDHPKQARIMEVGAILLDEQFKEVAIFNALIDIPDHVEVNPYAYEVHHISKVDCRTYGMPVEAAIINIDAFVSKSDYVVGHNIDFDLKMIRIEEELIFGQGRLVVPNTVCTMNLMTPICKMEPTKKRGFNTQFTYKWPKLQEAHKFLFPEVLPDILHSALGDCRTTARIFKWLFDNNYVAKLPSNVISMVPDYDDTNSDNLPHNSITSP